MHKYQVVKTNRAGSAVFMGIKNRKINPILYRDSTIY